MKKRKEYLVLLEQSIKAIHSAIDCYNRVYDEYKIETCLMLMTNAWELLGKAIILKDGGNIIKDKLGNTLSAKEVILKITELEEDQKDCIQQIISLRDQACHNVLPIIQDEILHHLFYFGCKFHKELIEKRFNKYQPKVHKNYLSISFDNLTTYADKVQKVIGRLRKGSDGDKKLVWLLERGIKYTGTSYISQDEFEKQYRGKKKIMPHLEIGKYLKSTEMVRIVPIQAPKNFTASLILRKGKLNDASLPIQIKKTDIEKDYPYLTNELGKKIGKNQQFIACTIKKLNIKGNPLYHQSVRASKSGEVNRYSDSALTFLRTYLQSNPDFNPYK